MCQRNNVLGARSPSSAMETMADGEDGGKEEHKYYNNHHQYYKVGVCKIFCQNEYLPIMRMAIESRNEKEDNDATHS